MTRKINAKNMMGILGNLLWTMHFSLFHNTVMCQLIIYLLLVVVQYLRIMLSFKHRLCYDVMSDISVLKL